MQALFVFVAAAVIAFLTIQLARAEPVLAIMGPNYGRVSAEKRAEIEFDLIQYLFDLSA